MTKDLNSVVPSGAAFSPTFIYNSPLNYSEKTPTTSEELAAQIEAKSANLGYGLGEAFARTSAGKFLQDASAAISKIADVIGNFIPSLPAASAEAVKDHPKNSPQIKTAKKLKSSAPKIIGRYNLLELQVLEDKIYFDHENGDWFFSFLKLEPLNNFTEIEKTPSVYLVKKSELFDMVRRDAYDDFYNLVLKARSSLAQQIKTKHGLLQMIFGDIVHEAWSNKEYKNITPSINTIFNFEYSEEFDLQIINFFSNQRKRLEGMTAMSRDDYRIYLQNFYDNEFKNIIISHLAEAQTDANIEALWKKIKAQDLSSSAGLQELLNKYRSREQSNLKNEKYFDRIEKTRKINNDANFICIISSGNAGTLRESAPPAGLVFSTSAFTNRFHPNIVWNFFTPYNSIARTTTHEALHMFDNQICLADKSGFTVSEIDSSGEVVTIPCNNEPVKDKKITDKLIKAFDFDTARFIKFINSIVKNKGTNIVLLFADAGYRTTLKNVNDDIKSLDNAFKAMSVLKIDTEYMEIIPYITDTLNPIQLISFCPNIAVIRSKTIYNDELPGTALYMAIMECDVDSVKNMIKKNPSILNEEYDGIKLHELAKILTESGYDQFMNKDFKKDGKDNKHNYAGMSSMVQKEYEAYKKSKVKNLSDIEEKSSKEREL